MNRSYFEDLEASERRFAERQMLFCALRGRRARSRGLLVGLLWLLGSR
jgi:hypothetical protein